MQKAETPGGGNLGGGGEWLPIENGLPTKHLNQVPITANNNGSVSASSDTSSMVDNITFIPQFTAKFEFGVGVKLDTPAKAIGFTANYASLNFIGFENNDWYFAGKNVSEDSDVREINEEYSFSFGGYGFSSQSTYENGLSGELMQEKTSITYRGFVKQSVIELPRKGLIINQILLNLGAGFGIILMPEFSVNLILYSDTTRHTTH